MKLHFLRNVDIFGHPISLNYNGHDQFRTKFGGIMSVILITFLTFLLISKVSNFWYKETISVTEITRIDPEPDLHILNKENFMFAISIEQFKSAYNKNPFFQIEVVQRSYEKQENGEKIKTSNIIQVEPCTLEHWLNIQTKHAEDREQYWATQFKNNNLQNWLCPNKDYQLRLAGAFHSRVFEFIKIQINNCQENNEKYTEWKNYKCAEKEELQNHLDQYGNFRFQLYSSNYQINAQSNEDLEIPYLQSDLHFSFKPKDKYQTVDIYVENVDIATNKNIFMPENYEHSQYPILNFNQVRSDQGTNNNNEKNGISKFYIRKSQLNSYLTRQFYHVNDLLSYIGGYTQFFLILFGFFVGYFNYLQQLVSFINNLYIIKDENNQVNKPFQDGSQNALNTNNEEYLHKQFQQMMANIVKFRINIKYLVYKFSKHKFYKNTDNLFIDKGIDLAQKQTDIMQIIGKLHEFDKLKSLLLSKDQLYIFNCIPKAVLEKQTNKNLNSLDNLTEQPVKRKDHNLKCRSSLRQLKSFLQQDKQFDLVKQQEYTNLDVQNSMYQIHQRHKNAQKSIKFLNKLDISYNKLLVVLKAKKKFLSFIADKRLYHQDNFRQFKKNMYVMDKIQENKQIDHYQKYINMGLYQQMGTQIKNAYRSYKNVGPNKSQTHQSKILKLTEESMEESKQLFRGKNNANTEESLNASLALNINQLNESQIGNGGKNT